MYVSAKFLNKIKYYIINSSSEFFSCIGCQSRSKSHTSWQFWRTKFAARPLRFTYTVGSQNVSAAELYVHLPSRCWSNRSPGQTFPGVLSGFQHRLQSETRWHRLSICL